MPEVSTPSVSQTEIEAGPNYFAFHIHEIEELFAQKEDLITSVSSKDPMLSAGTCATVKDGIDDNHCKTKEGATPSLSTALFYNGVGDKLSVLKKERLESSLKESVNVFNQEVDETLHSVLGMYKVKKSLRAREDIANNSISAADVYKRQSFVKKRKLSHSPSSTGVAKYDEEQDDVIQLQSSPPRMASISEGRGIKDSDVVSSEESLSKDLERICLECKTTSTPQWREGPAGILCNACGIRNKKKGMSPQGLKEVEKTTKPELDDDLKFLLDVEGPHAQEIVKEVLKKYSDELDGKLGHMEQQLEKYLDVVVSKSRKMSVEEKLELKKLIHNLPQKNLDRVVEIIVHHRKLPEELPCNEIRVDLENEDDVTLWRLYYYTKAAEKAKRFQDKKN